MTAAAAATAVLVHGAWGTASNWHTVRAALAERGVESVAVDLPGHGASTEPLGDLHADADTVRRVIDTVDGPVLLVGHSYGGAVITDAGTHPAVTGLLYVAAYLLDEGETVAELATAGDDPGDLGAAMRFSDDHATIAIDPELVRPVLYDDAADPDLATELLGQLTAQSTSGMAQTARSFAWRDRPSTYLLCSEDRAVPAPIQERMAAKAGEVITWATGHCPQFARPDDFADLVADLARRAASTAMPADAAPASNAHPEPAP